MKAKKLKEKLIDSLLPDRDCKCKWCKADRKLLETFIDQLCKEQREECADIEGKNVWIDDTPDSSGTYISCMDIRNAPMPDL